MVHYITNYIYYYVFIYVAPWLEPPKPPDLRGCCRGSGGRGGAEHIHVSMATVWSSKPLHISVSINMLYWFSIWLCISFHMFLLWLFNVLDDLFYGILR